MNALRIRAAQLLYDSTGRFAKAADKLEGTIYEGYFDALSNHCAFILYRLTGKAFNDLDPVDLDPADPAQWVRDLED